MLLHVCTNLHVYKLEIDLCFSHAMPLSSGISLFSLELAIGEAGWLASEFRNPYPECWYYKSVPPYLSFESRY